VRSSWFASRAERHPDVRKRINHPHAAARRKSRSRHSPGFRQYRRALADEMERIELKREWLTNNAVAHDMCAFAKGRSGVTCWDTMTPHEATRHSPVLTLHSRDATLLITAVCGVTMRQRQSATVVYRREANPLELYVRIP
jgi:HD superfamily phosphohydrolase YqeK